MTNKVEQADDAKVGVVDETGHFACPYCDQVIGIPSCDALQREVARLRADAERYRWLRKGGYPLCELDDAAIDAAKGCE